MYPYYFKKKSRRRMKTAWIEDCFAQRARYWLWFLGIVVFLVVIYSIVKLTDKEDAFFINYQTAQLNGYAGNVAFRPCPYCRGILDSQGRCNIRDCPVYSPAWGTGSEQPV